MGILNVGKEMKQVQFLSTPWWEFHFRKLWDVTD